MRLFAPFLMLIILALTGCNSYNLRYEAIPQPKNRHLYADFHQLQDAIGIAIDTDGRRLEDVYIRRSDGAIIRPANIAYPAFGHSAYLSPGIGVGVEHVGVGTSLGFPVGPRRAQGLTSVLFEQAVIGPPPWELHVTVHGSPEAIIPGVGGPPTVKD